MSIPAETWIENLREKLVDVCELNFYNTSRGILKTLPEEVWKNFGEDLNKTFERSIQWKFRRLFRKANFLNLSCRSSNVMNIIFS